MPVAHIDSYYAASANPAPDRPPLAGDVEADVCVVGGGIAGCATALFLAERGYRVVLLEGHRIGFGASGRSGGQAIVGYACSQDKLVAQVGPADARKMSDISVDALTWIKALIAKAPNRLRPALGTCAHCDQAATGTDLRAYQKNWSTSTAIRRRAGSTSRTR
jgi:gamma-glutamylputrescine oxidase